jgi:fructokinase
MEEFYRVCHPPLYLRKNRGFLLRPLRSLRFKTFLTTKGKQSLNAKFPKKNAAKCAKETTGMKDRYTIVGIGEVLWDMLPDSKQLGGAPANFAYISSLLGDDGIVASRVGSDPLGHETLQKMSALGLSTRFLQLDPQQPTGTARVNVDTDGQPVFLITEPAAWDFLEWSTEWQTLAHNTDIVCFGTLAQRSAQSRDTIRQFLHAVPNTALRIWDMNLRQEYFSAEVLEESFKLSQVVKLNHEELLTTIRTLGLNSGSEEDAARRLLSAYGLKLVCITRGARGSLLVSPSGSASHPGFQVKVMDTVGTGDAFTACLVHHFVRGAPLDQINESANRFAAWVASQPGATPSRDSGTPKT